MPVINMGGSNLGKGPYNGWSPKQTLNNFKDSEQTAIRSVLRRSWNGQNATGTYNNANRITTPFRAVNNSGDFLSRTNYACGGPNPITPNRYNRAGNLGTMPKMCDSTGVPASSCNVKFVADSSDYIKFKKHQAINKNYNDLAFGGDQNNASYVNRMAVHRY